MSMKLRFTAYGVALTAMLGVLSLLLVSMPAAQNQQGNAAAFPDPYRQNVAAGNAAATPRLANGKPDFSGYYRGGIAGVSNAQPDEQAVVKTADGSVFFAYGGALAGVEAAEDGNTVENAAAADAQRNPVPYKPEYKAQAEALAKYGYGPRDNLKDPANICKPDGVVRSPIDNMYIVHNADAVGVMFEKVPGAFFRVIYTDGRKHPERFDSSFYGHSIGHWEGDTLVVDTIGLNDETWLGGLHTQSVHSDQIHVVERWTRNGNTIDVQMTVEDPVMFTKPWVTTHRMRLGPEGDYLMPIPCVDVSSRHQIANSPQDTFKCNWCNSEDVYGGDPNKLTVPKEIRK
jgi:hypothetical protein